MKVLIDANVILRYLLNDIPEMSEKAKRTIDSGAYTIPEIIAEVVYVLKGVYKINRNAIGDALIDLLYEIEIEPHSVMIKSLDIYAKSKFDFVDCILLSRHQLLGEKIFTFDKKLNAQLENSQQ